jgi:hypothetical protein
MAIKDLKNKWREFNWRETNWREIGKSLPARGAAVARSPLWQRRAAWAVGILLLVWALAYAAMPSILKSQLEKIASEKLGRQVTVGEVDFKPWSLELTLRDLAIAGPARPKLPAISPDNTPAFHQAHIYRCRTRVPAAICAGGRCGAGRRTRGVSHPPGRWPL